MCVSAPTVHSATPTFSHVRAIALPFSEVSHTCSYAQSRKKIKGRPVGGGNKSVDVGWCVRHRSNSVPSSLSLADTKMLNVDVVLVVCASFVSVSGQKA